MKQERIVKIDNEDFEDLLKNMELLFNIRFDFDKIYDCITVGEIIDMIIEKSVYPESSQCSFQLIFFRLRKDLAQNLFIPSKNIRPDTPLENIFPAKQRRQIWKKMFRFSPISCFPSLKPHRLIWLPIMGLILTCIWIKIDALTVLTLTLFLIFFFTVFRMLKNRNHFPCHTVGELAQLLIKMNYADIRKEFQTFNRREIEDIICELIGEWNLETPTNKVTTATRISYIKANLAKLSIGNLYSK